MSIDHNEAMTNAEYKRDWYPEELQIANKGKLHLIHSTFVEWAFELILFAMNFFTELKMIKHRRDTVNVAAQHLKDNKSLFFHSGRLHFWLMESTNKFLATTPY